VVRQLFLGSLRIAK
jgi:hypothetical protein